MNKIILGSQKLTILLKRFWRKPILILLLLLLLDFVFIGFLFLNYYFRSQEKTEVFVSLGIKQNLADQLSLLEKRRRVLFEEAGQRQYPDLFRGPESRIEEIEEIE